MRTSGRVSTHTNRVSGFSDDTVGIAIGETTQGEYENNEVVKRIVGY